MISLMSMDNYVKILSKNKKKKNLINFLNHKSTHKIILLKIVYLVVEEWVKR